MYRATEYQLPQALVCAFLAWGFSLAQAQSIGDYSRAQRAVLESEMAKNIAKAMGASASTPGTAVLPAMALRPLMGGPAATTALSGMAPMPAVPPMEAMPAARSAAPSDEIAISGVIVLASRAMAELQTGGNTFLLFVGDKVPGTPWVVQSIKADQVVLNSGRQSRTFNVAAGLR
jgi:hypothetical protein